MSGLAVAAEPRSTALRARAPTLADAIRWGVVALLAALFAWRIVGGVSPAERFFDDFFYYLKPALSWVETGRVEYFPGEPTNGFHILWFLWVAALCKLCGGASDAFFVCLDLRA